MIQAVSIGAIKQNISQCEIVEFIALEMNTQTYTLIGFLSNNGELAKELNDKYRIIMPITLQYFWHSKRKYLDYISDSLRWHYFGNQEIGANTSTSISRVS